MKHNLNEYKELFKCISDGSMYWKVAIYVRLSKDDGNSVSLSIINQIKKIARYFRNFENFYLYDIYIDDGLTGTDFDRSDFLRLQNDVDNKFVNCIIVKDLTRYSRNLADGIKQLDDYVLEKKIRFISVGIPDVDTYLDPTAISSSEVYQALQNAEDFARITSKKVRDIKEIKRYDGEKNGGFPPFGYLPNPDGEHWLPDPNAHEIIKKMFLWSLDGVSDREIAKKLNSEGIPNPTLYKQQVLGLNYKNPHASQNQGLWWPSTVHRILADKTYIGCSVQGKSSSFDHKRHKQIPKKKDEYVIVENCHEKAVDRELFEKVSEKRKERTRVTRSGKPHLFANLVYCSNCNKAMKKNACKGHEYLVCRTYREIGKEYCTAKRTISFKVLENIILVAIKEQIKLVSNLYSIIEQINQHPVISNQSVRINELVERTKMEISKVEHIVDSSYYDWKNEDITKEQYNRVRNDMGKKLEQLRNTLQSLLEEQQQLSKGIKSNNQYFETFMKYKNIETLDRTILVDLIERIYINEDKSVKIHFKYNNQYLLILDYINQNENQKKLIKKK